MCDGTSTSKIGLGLGVAGAIGETYSSYRKSAGEAQGYEYQSAVARSNAQVAEWQALDAEERGKLTARNVGVKGRQFLGKQKAAFGARNVAMNEGSALNILADTEYGVAFDVNTAKDNAAKEAWMFRNQATNYASNANFLQERADAQSPFLDAAGTALTSGGRVAAHWYSTRKSVATPAAAGYRG